MPPRSIATETTTIPSPRENPALFGHEAAEATTAAAIAARRVHHAWLVTGSPGIGKATFAYRFARLLLSGGTRPNDPASPPFRRVAAATHADLLTIERQWDDKRKRRRTEIVVDDSRDVAGFLHLTPAEGGWRVVVVDGAEDLNPNAANALLKVLEEPPPGAVLLLTCDAPGRLLPTVRSRCRRLNLAPLKPADMDAALSHAMPALDAAARARLIEAAEGSPGRAVQMADTDTAAVAALVDRALQHPPGIPHAYELADKVGRMEDGFATFMDMLRHRLDRTVRAAARGQADPAQRKLLGSRPLAQWGEVWHALGRLQDDTERSNLDKRHAIVSGLDLLRTDG